MRLLILLSMLAGCGARTGVPFDEAPETEPEACNAVDDDGDGLIDESIPDIREGVGACECVAPGCVDGVAGACVPGPPNAETCDGVDNDCNGIVDDGLAPELISGPVTVFAGAFSNGTELVQTPDGLLAVIAAASIGAAPNNVLVTRTLGFDGEPTAEPRIVDIQPRQGPTMTPSADGLFAGTICTPAGSENRLSSFLMDATGELAGELVRRSPTRSCGAGESHSIWTGERHLTAWVENSSAPTFDSEVLYDVSDEDLRSIDSEILLDATGDLTSQPYFARVGDRILMVAGRIDPPDFDRMLMTWVFDLRGRRLAGPIEIETPEDFSPRQPRLVATGDDALLLVTNRFGPGILVGKVDTEGAVRDLRFMEGTRGRYDYPEVAAKGDAIVMSATVTGEGLSENGEVLGLDSSGEILWSYLHVRPEEFYFGWSSLVTRGGRTYVLYTAPLEEEYFEERLIVLGCAP